MIYFTSDLHFNHDKDFVWEARGFKSVEEMNSAIIKRWNDIITDEDVVYILGDIMLGDNNSGIKLFNQLNGRKNIVCGNHDTNTRRDFYWIQGKKIENIYDCAVEIKVGKKYFWLCHYPTNTANYDDGKPWAKHVINLFGHTHQGQPFYNDNPYMYNVGMDAHNCTPVSIDTIIENIREKKEQLDRDRYKEEQLDKENYKEDGVC